MIIIILCLGLVLILLGAKGDRVDEKEEDGLEERIAAACSDVEGVGECSVYVYYSAKDSYKSAEEVESVIVICQGGDSAEVRLKLTEMLASFFGIGSNRVRIEKMKS